MADIPGIGSLGNLLPEWNLALIGQRVLLGLEIGVAFGLVLFVILHFMVKPRKYKDLIEIIDLETNQKYTDKGYLKDNRDGTQEYVLRKHKKAKIPNPPASVFTTKRGNKILQLVKYGPGDYNWASTKEVWDEATKDIAKFQVTNITDQNWNKYKIKSEAEKKTKTNAFLQYLPQIMVGAVIVMFIISAWYITGVMKQGIATSGAMMQRADDITADLAEVAVILAGCSVGGSSSNNIPPPDI